MWPFTPKTLYDRYSKLMRLIMSIDSHFEVTENKEDSVRLHLPNYKGNQPMDFHIYLMEPFLFISFATEVEGDKISCLNNFPQNIDQQEMFNTAMANNLNKIHQVLESKYRNENQAEEINNPSDSNQETQRKGNSTDVAIDDLKENFDYDASYKRHALTFMILLPNTEFRYYSQQDDKQLLWIYNDKKEYKDKGVYLWDNSYVTGIYPFVWYIKKYDNKEELCWVFDFLNRQNTDLWAEASAKKTQDLIDEIRLYVPSLKIGNDPQRVKTAIEWAWIDIQSFIRFIDYCMNSLDWAVKPDDKLNTPKDCGTIHDLGYLMIKECGFVYGKKEELFSNLSTQEQLINNDPAIVESWSFIDFAKIHGQPKLTKPATYINRRTGEEFTARSVAFVHPTEIDEHGGPLITFIDFSTDLGELTAQEIAEKHKELVVVKSKTGKYVLTRMHNNSIAQDENYLDADNFTTEVSEKDLVRAWTDEYGVKYSADKKRILKAPKTLKEYSIRTGTRIICNMAFRDCRDLNTIHIPDSTNLIGFSAFEGCSNLKSIIIPNSVISIGVNAFWGCVSLFSVQLSNQIKSIRHATFWGCKSLTSITIPDNVRSIGIAAFSKCENLWFLNIPNSVFYIGSQAFYGCKRLTSITIPYGVKRIQGGAFAGCSSLRSIDIPDSVDEIGEKLLYECIELHSIKITMGTMKIFRELIPNNLHAKIVEIDRRNEGRNSTQVPDEVDTSWTFQGFKKGYKRMNTSRVYCPVTKCIEHVILFEREDGNNAVVYNLAALTFDQINTSKNNLSIELRKSGCYYLNKCDTIENQSTLLFAEEWDGISITSIKNNEVIDTTSCYNFSNSWSLLEFSELHGKMRVEQIKEDMTGREFTSLLFTDGLGREIKALSFDNMNQVSLYHVLKKVDKFRIGADPLHFCTPSFYYLYDKTLPFWLPGMDV